ncbi:pathogenesis-related thaumatin superfamily protein [Actinidia rufa]|uniref:Pathogenesis-related thaumatin superfamily protein n=1 Tax=Actinidia rufa TaxID=165716 RepID=A0A7J0FW12_9ERIC|nr:pathogenesis-related thaumatin superfamily protein [Actinidia rufa]
MNGGLELNPGQPINVNAPTGWSGRFWGRTGCFFDQSGKGYCATGNCGGGVAECAGAGGEPPATLAEFTLNSPLDFYDISLVDGFNIPVSVVPTGAVRGFACLAFNQPEYCCTGAYNNPNTCKPSNYSRVFKDSCPAAYSYAYDDSSSIFTCKGANYLITFC